MKTIIFSLFLFSGLCLAAQKNSFIVMVTGDTLHGTYVLSSGKIELSDAGHIIKQVNPDSVRSLFSGNELFLIWHGMLRTYNDNIETVQNTTYHDEVYDTSMLVKQIYTTEKMNLYFAVDKNRIQYYFVKRPADPQPEQMVVSYAISRPYNGDDRPGYNYSMINQQRIYVDQLKQLMNYCNKISDEIWGLMDYRIYSFKKIIKLYNKKCK
ncbi:MAG: hypothetical protein ABJA78_04120 [Ferruginibacter sp.]